MSNDLTLLIPAKKEKESIARVLREIDKYKLKYSIILERNDILTINSIKNSGCKNYNILYQNKKGYGNALRFGINNCDTKYFCIFNADGSFNPREIENMYKKIKIHEADFIFASRYEKGCKSDDDTFLTRVGNYFFTKLGNIFFKLQITDILYTFVLGNIRAAKNLKLKNDDFRLCVELPIRAKLNKKKILTSKSHERKRLDGKKKVNEFRDGYLILSEMLKFLYKSYKKK